jgi:hypothetical protein
VQDVGAQMLVDLLVHCPANVESVTKLPLIRMGERAGWLPRDRRCAGSALPDVAAALAAPRAELRGNLEIMGSASPIRSVLW